MTNCTSPNLNRLISAVTRMALDARAAAGRPLRAPCPEIVQIQVDGYRDLRDLVRLDGREDLTQLEADTLIEVAQEKLATPGGSDATN